MSAVAEPMAAVAIFDRPARPETRSADLEILTAAAGLHRFTIQEVTDLVGVSYWYGRSQQLLRVLWLEGHLRRVSPDGRKPIVYEWSDDA